MEHGCTWITLPRERFAQLEQFAVQVLESSGFGKGPTSDTWRVEERKFSALSSRSTSGVKRHERARFVVQKNWQTKVDVEETDQAIQREVVLRHNHNPGLVESLERTLAMKFRRVKQDEGRVISRMAKRMEQPRRNPLARGDVFRCDDGCSLHENRLFGKTPPRLFQHTRHHE